MRAQPAAFRDDFPECGVAADHRTRLFVGVGRCHFTSLFLEVAKMLNSHCALGKTSKEIGASLLTIHPKVLADFRYKQFCIPKNWLVFPSILTEIDVEKRRIYEL